MVSKEYLSCWGLYGWILSRNCIFLINLIFSLDINQNIHSDKKNSISSCESRFYEY